MEIGHGRYDTGSERAARRHVRRRLGRDGFAAARAVALVQVDARRHRFDGRQIDVVVSGDVGLIGRRQASSAIAALGIDLPDMVGFWAQRTGHARPALAALAARLGTIGLLAFRGRHRRVRRRLGRDSEPGFERGHPGGQGGVLLAEHADLLGLRQHQRDQLGLVQSVQRISVHSELGAARINAINSPESVGRTLKPHRKGVSNYFFARFTQISGRSILPA